MRNWSHWPLNQDCTPALLGEIFLILSTEPPAGCMVYHITLTHLFQPEISLHRKEICNTKREGVKLFDSWYYYWCIYLFKLVIRADVLFIICIYLDARACLCKHLVLCCGFGDATIIVVLFSLVGRKESVCCHLIFFTLFSPARTQLLGIEGHQVCRCYNMTSSCFIESLKTSGCKCGPSGADKWLVCFNSMETDPLWGSLSILLYSMAQAKTWEENFSGNLEESIFTIHAGKPPTNQ